MPGKETPKDIRVVHVSPMYFGDESVIGGGERYAVELARAMARMTPTTLVSFGSRRDSFRLDDLQVHIYPSWHLSGHRDHPVSLSFLRELPRADVLHCHHLGTSSTVISLLAGRALRRRRFVTPLGLAVTRTEHRLIRVAGMSGLLCISDFSARQSAPWYAAPFHVIRGGVDLARFRPGGRPKQRKVVCVARLVPHKGINYLIEALDGDMPLALYGRPYDQRFYRDLKAIARGKDVTFHTDASDDEIVDAYSTALVSVLPSVYTDMYGAHVPQPELLGLVLLESMACGTPVVGTRVGAIPEYIEEGRTGYVVPPNDPDAIRQVVRALFANPERAARLGENGHDLVRREYTWDAVARRCLDAYRASS